MANVEIIKEGYPPSCADGRSPLKHIAAIHDLSSFGRCALTVIMPTLSAMGYQVVPVPTCLLSSHTGGFTDMSFLDLTDNMEDIYAHFDRLDLKFDAVYSGFLGNGKQIEIVGAFENTVYMVGVSTCKIFVAKKHNIYVAIVINGIVYSAFVICKSFGI